MNRTMCMLLVLTAFAAGLCPQRAAAAEPVISVIVFANGYHYGPAGMELARVLDDSVALPGIRADFANSENILTPGSLNRYDVLVLFNHNDITRSHEQNITDFVHDGGGLLALHHVINKANDNPELTRLIGGYYDVADGIVEHRDFYIEKIQGAEHPILDGIPDRFKVYDDQDFRMRFYPDNDIIPLLTNDITGNGEQQDCGWVRTEQAGRIVYLSPGDPVAKNPFVKNQPLFQLIVNSVRWVAGE